MSATRASVNPVAPDAPRSGARRGPVANPPFFGVLDCVLVDSLAQFSFPGAIGKDHAAAVWRWVRQDLAGDILDPAMPDDDPAGPVLLEPLIPELLGRMRTALAAVTGNPDLERRFTAQLGSDAARARVGTVVTALKCRALLEKAQAFGRATNGMHDEQMLAHALQSMPLGDKALTALLMQAAVGQVANPSRLMAAAIRVCGSATESAVLRAGFGPLVEAILAHAQNQLPALAQSGVFADLDLICRSVDRFHRLVRAVSGYVELSRLSPWTTTIASLTKTLSEGLEPRLQDVMPNMSQALRRGREGADRLDAELLLAALGGMYLVSTVRECRDSLAVNAVFDQIWLQTGQALEIHAARCIEQVRTNPGDVIAGARLDAVIKMAEQRFGHEYAEVLRRARESAERRAAAAQASAAGAKTA